MSKFDKLSAFSSNYFAVDGTGVRNFIYVIYLAQGHVAVLDYSEKRITLNESGTTTQNSVGFIPINLGTRKSTSVLELVFVFFEVSRQSIPYQFIECRAGDIASCHASTDKARKLLE